MQDVKAACQSCHVKDYNERAQIYADKLGVKIGSGAAPAAGANASEPAKPAPGAPQPASNSNPIVVEKQPVIDYVEQYNQSVLGQTSVNWGNIIVAIMIVMIVILGGTVVFFNERKLRGSPARKNTIDAAGNEIIRLEDYPEDVIALLPRLKALNPVGRKALGKLLKNPEAAAELLLTLSRLDPDLIKQMKGLDRDAQALLIALAGD